MLRHRVEVAAPYLDVLPVLQAIDFAYVDMTADDRGLIELVDGMGIVTELSGDRTRILIFDEDGGVSVRGLIDAFQQHGLECRHEQLG